MTASIILAFIFSLSTLPWATAEQKHRYLPIVNLGLPKVVTPSVKTFTTHHGWNASRNFDLFNTSKFNLSHRNRVVRPLCMNFSNVWVSSQTTGTVHQFASSPPPPPPTPTPPPSPQVAAAASASSHHHNHVFVCGHQASWRWQKDRR